MEVDVSSGGSYISGDIKPSNTLRVNPWGAAENTVPNQEVSSTAESNSQIISLNESINNLVPAGDKRKNYILIGNTWTFGGELPSQRLRDRYKQISKRYYGNLPSER